MRSLCAVLAVLGVAGASCSKEPPPAPAPENEPTATARQGIAGNIAPGAIEIDESANVDPGTANADVLNPTADLDWVLDDVNNVAEEGCLDPLTSIADCIQEGVTGAVGGTGHWNGIRIVDGIAGADQDIFLTGGKENDVSTWNIGPGTVGASKSDLTQAYLANNQTNLFFGMERRANNGTTAFDFEFNQVAPGTGSCPGEPGTNNLVPCRTENDVLFTFEMQGSGQNGSATPHVYLWNPTPAPGRYVEETDPIALVGVFSSINLVATPAAPWGRVDKDGNWVLTDFEKFEFAEATAPMELLTGEDAQCGGTAYVQVRTRSSSTANSDLKDTSKIFEFQFNSITAEATLDATCGPSVHYEATGTDPTGEDLVNPVCTWTFTLEDGTEDPPTLTKTGCSGDLLAADLGDAASVSASVTVEAFSGDDCAATATADSGPLARPITVSLTPSAGKLECTDDEETSIQFLGDAIVYTATIEGGDAGEDGLFLTWSVECAPDDDEDERTCTVSAGPDNLCFNTDIWLRVDDDAEADDEPETGCAPATSETETYDKITEVTSTDNAGGGGGSSTSSTSSASTGAGASGSI